MRVNVLRLFSAQWVVLPGILLLAATTSAEVTAAGDRSFYDRTVAGTAMPCPYNLGGLAVRTAMVGAVGRPHSYTAEAQDTLRARALAKSGANDSVFLQNQKAAQSGRTQKVANPLNDLVEEVRRDIEASHFEEAIPPLEKILAEQPDFAWAHFQLAYAYTALQKPAEAQAEYQRTITLDPKMSEAYLNLGILLLEQRKASDAIAPLGKAVELLPSQSRPRVLLGLAQERAGEKAAAAESLEGAVHLDPHDQEALGHLANLYLSLNRPADAEAKLRAALESKPNDPATLLLLAKTIDAEKKPEAAAEAYRNYLAVRPNDAEAQSRLVHLFVDAQQYDAALAELDQLQNGRAPTLELLRLRADILVAQKKLDDAAATLRQALTLAPQDAQLHGGLGRLYLEKRDFANAEGELKAAIQLDGKNIAYWKDLSSTYYLSKNYPATLAIYDKLDQVDPPNAGRWFIRALCYDNLKQLQPALEAYQKFLELDQNKDSNQVWQAQQRSKVLKRELEQKH